MSTNINTTAFGFRPLCAGLTGSPGRVKQYGQPASDSHTIFQSDMVTQVASSSVAECGYPGLPVRNIESYSQATPGTTPILGAVLNGGKPSLLQYFLVIDDPMALFVAMFGDDVPTAFTIATHGGRNANIANTAAAAGALHSAMYVEDTGNATTNTLDLKINGGLSQAPNVEAAYAIVEVKINRHQLENQVAGV
jgi:hypothetical protein